MEQQKVEFYMTTHQKYFPEASVMYLRERLLQIDDNKFALLSALELQDPMTMLLVSIFAGGFGVDRFMLGDTTMGIVKLLTGGACGVLTIMDWCTIQDQTKTANLKKVEALL